MNLAVLLRLSDLGVGSVTLNRIMREPRSPNSLFFFFHHGHS